MKKAQHIIKMVLICLLFMGMAQSSFAGRNRAVETTLSFLTLSANISQNTFTSVHSRRFERQAINIGWSKRGKKIIQMKIEAGFCREDYLSVPNLIVNNPVPNDPNYFLLRFSCFSHRGPPITASLS